MPLILALDTSSESMTIALAEGPTILLEERMMTSHSHSKNLLSLIDSSLKKKNLQLKDIDAFATTIGPGSFSGIRTGLGTIKGFGFITGKPIIAISTLYAMAYPCREYTTVTPVLEAKKDSVYMATYQWDKMWNEIQPARMIPMSELKNLSNETTFIGPACEKHRDFFSSDANIGNSKFGVIYGKILAEIAHQKYMNKELEDVFSLEPLYIQKTAAEGYV